LAWIGKKLLLCTCSSFLSADLNQFFGRRPGQDASRYPFLLLAIQCEGHGIALLGEGHIDRVTAPELLSSCQLCRQPAQCIIHWDELKVGDSSQSCDQALGQGRPSGATRDGGSNFSQDNHW